MRLRRLFQNKERRDRSPRELIEDGKLHLNEAVNVDLATIFVAIPKTGTTSVRTQLKPDGSFIIKTPHLNILQIRDSLYTYCLLKNLRGNHGFPTRNVRADEEVREEADRIFSSFFKFSAVRNPFARAVSLYYRTEGVQVSHDMSFSDFCRQHIYASDTCRNPTLHRNQADWISDEGGRIIMDYVYKLEDFADAVREISNRTQGRVVLDAVTRNRNPSSLSNKYRDLYDDETKRIIASRFEKDIDLFKYSF